MQESLTPLYAVLLDLLKCHNVESTVLPLRMSNFQYRFVSVISLLHSEWPGLLAMTFLLKVRLKGVLLLMSVDLHSVSSLSHNC